MADARGELISRACELGCFDDPEERTDQQLAAAIAAEEASIGWFQRFEQLPNDAAKRAAVHRLAQRFQEIEASIPRVSCKQCGKTTREDLQPCLACSYSSKGSGDSNP